MARYQLTNDPAVVFDSETHSLVQVSGSWMSDAYQAWIGEGNTPDPVPGPTFADYVSIFSAGLQQWMEDTAKQNIYDSVLSCVSYKDSNVEQFKGDALAMLDWRDALWKWASDWQVGFNGEMPSVIPTLEQVKAMAPQPQTFGWVVHTPGQIIEAQVSNEQQA